MSILSIFGRSENKWLAYAVGIAMSPLCEILARVHDLQQTNSGNPRTSRRLTTTYWAGTGLWVLKDLIIDLSRPLKLLHVTLSLCIATLFDILRLYVLFDLRICLCLFIGFNFRPTISQSYRD